MPAAERRKGNRAEQQVAETLRQHGWRAITSRDGRGGAQGGGDIITDFPAVLEVKDHARLDLAGWVDQVVEEAGVSPGFVIHKRRGKSDPELWYVTGQLGDLILLVKDLTGDKP